MCLCMCVCMYRLIRTKLDGASTYIRTIIYMRDSIATRVLSDIPTPVFFGVDCNTIMMMMMKMVWENIWKYRPIESSRKYFFLIFDSFILADPFFHYKGQTSVAIGVSSVLLTVGFGFFFKEINGLSTRIEDMNSNITSQTQTKCSHTMDLR